MYVDMVNKRSFNGVINIVRRNQILGNVLLTNREGDYNVWRRRTQIFHFEKHGGGVTLVDSQFFANLDEFR